MAIFGCAAPLLLPLLSDPGLWLELLERDFPGMPLVGRKMLNHADLLGDDHTPAAAPSARTYASWAGHACELHNRLHYPDECNQVGVGGARCGSCASWNCRRHQRTCLSCGAPACDDCRLCPSVCVRCSLGQIIVMRCGICQRAICGGEGAPFLARHGLDKVDCPCSKRCEKCGRHACSSCMNPCAHCGTRICEACSFLDGTPGGFYCGTCVGADLFEA